MGRNLFEELLYINPKESEPEETIEEDANEVEEQDNEEESANISFVGSPVYPRVFWGDSAKPLNGQFPNSEYVDDNIHRTYEGLLSYFG